MTRKEKIQKLILIVSLMIICGFLISTYYKTPPKQNIAPTTESQTNPIGKTSGITTLLINGTKFETQIARPMSVYDFMTQLQNEGKITFQGKIYAGMGEFIEEINGTKNSGDKNWIYYVDGAKPKSEFQIIK